MADPYRDAGGTPCVRCKQPLSEEPETGDLVCLSGCGRFLPTAAITKLFPLELVKSRATANPFKVEAFKPARCPFCRAVFDDCYAGFADPIPLGFCILHGAWIDFTDRRKFLGAYEQTIQEYAAVFAKAQAYEAFAEKVVSGDADTLRLLLARIITLSDSHDALVTKVAQLEARLVQVEGRGPWQ